MLTAPQFIYAAIRRNEDRIVFLPGTCRFCGGRLFRDDRYSPFPADEKNFHMRVAGLAKDKGSPKMCPACRYIYANLNNTAGGNFREDPAAKEGVFKLLPEKKGAVHGIVASKGGFVQYGDWVEFGKALCDPPEPPFVAMATEDRGGFLYSVWKAVVACSRDFFPVCYVRSFKITEQSSASMAVTAWIDRKKFAQALALLAQYKKLRERQFNYRVRCAKTGVKAKYIPAIDLPDAPDWQLAYRCAPGSAD